MAAVQLRVLKGKHEGKSLPLAPGRFVVGREEGCDLRPNSEMISRRHCAFTVTDEDVTLADLGSTNGTLVNDTPIEGTVWLQHGDVVTVGTLSFEVVFGDESVEVPPQSRLPTEPPVGPLTETSKEFRMQDDASRHTISLDDLAVLPPSADEPTSTVPAYEDPFAGLPAPPPAEIPAYEPPPPPPPPPVPQPTAAPPTAPAPPPRPPAVGSEPSPATSEPEPAAAPPQKPKPNVAPLPVQLPDPSEVGVRDEEGAGKRPKRRPPTREVNPSEEAADLLKKYAEVMQPKPKDE